MEDESRILRSKRVLKSKEQEEELAWNRREGTSYTLKEGNKEGRIQIKVIFIWRRRSLSTWKTEVDSAE